MKLQKRLSRKVEGEEYYKWLVTIPPSRVRELGWEEGIELESETDGDKLTLMPISEDSMEEDESGPMTPYTEFKSVIESVLKGSEGGMTWSEIKENGDLPQTVPNNVWVSQLEDDIGLEREKEGSKTIWKLPNGQTNAD